MKKVILTLVVMVLGSFLMLGNANAIIFTMDQTQLLGLYETGKEPIAGTELGFVIPALGGAEYIGVMLIGSSGIGDILIGANSTGTPFGRSDNDGATMAELGLGSLVSFESYQLHIMNVDRSPWSYFLYFVSDGLDYDSADVEIAAGSSDTLALDLTGYSDTILSGITEIGFGIFADIPISGYDHAFDTIVTPIPEPATMLLLGSGLLGLAGFRRLKRRKV